MFNKKRIVFKISFIICFILAVVWASSVDNKEVENEQEKLTKEILRHNEAQGKIETKESLNKATLVTQVPIGYGILEQSFEYIGSLYFSERSALATEVSGIIDEIYVDEGQKIKKNQALAVLNSDLLKNEILAQEALLKQAKANFSKSKKDYARFKSLYESESISFKEYEDALFSMQAQEGSMQSIASTLTFLKEQQNKKTIKAPYDGVVLHKNLKRGEWVSVGASVFNVAKLTPLEATFEVSYEILRSLKVGDNLQVKIAQKTYNATISALIPLGDFKTRTFPVKLAIHDPNGELIQGLEVRAAFGLKDKNESLFVPREAIIPTLDGDVIFIADKNRAKKIFVQVKGYKDLKASITPLNANLTQNDFVITNGAQRLRDGDLIQVVKK
ncbi:MAG: efflux RND transporter periplasmic adaptor subunit [Helicobacteraceae bacterium]|nr:efflux RND transporter periplasmic adaptor subunit [Helicobacteraceae bacterium]